MVVVATGVAAFALEVGTAAFGQVPVTLNGPPVQVIPYVSELGAPPVTIAEGTVNPFAGADAGSTNNASDPGGSGGSDGSTGGNVGSSDSLTTMMGTSWGLTAIGNAQSVGVNPSALAAMCVLESGCGTTSGSGLAQGTFQMQPAAFNDGLKTALAANPALISQIVQGPGGVNDPTTAAIAASGYLMQAAQTLQNSGIADPTVAQARAYFNFGPTYGPEVANSNPGALMSSILPASFISQNKIGSATTVAQWNATIASKVGNSATQSVIM